MRHCGCELRTAGPTSRLSALRSWSATTKIRYAGKLVVWDCAKSNALSLSKGSGPFALVDAPLIVTAERSAPGFHLTARFHV
jgi:hypothetical protein